MILLLGGTSDSLIIMEQLVMQNHPTILSVATDYGKHFSRAFARHVVQKRMDQSEMEWFIRQHAIHLIVDATHPFASLVSQNAIQAATNTAIQYIRYERLPYCYPPEVICVSSTEEAIQQVNLRKGKVYLTTGSKSLHEYSAAIQLERLVVRVLPVTEVLNKCDNLGLKADQIHGLKGPFSYELDKALFTYSGADIMVTKESGLSDSMSDKVKAALDLDMTVIAIGRPLINYPLQYNTVESLMAVLPKYT